MPNLLEREILQALARDQSLPEPGASPADNTLVVLQKKGWIEAVPDGSGTGYMITPAGVRSLG